jgi:hypothetical protein
MYENKEWCISSGTFLQGMMRKNEGRAEAVIEGDGRAFFDLPNSWRTIEIYTTYHSPHSRLCAFVGTGFFRFFTEETHVAQTTRRSMGSDFLAQTRPDDCRNLSHDWLRPAVCYTLYIEIQRLWLS